MQVMWREGESVKYIDHVAVKKQERECAIVDIAVAGDKRIVEKQNEEVKKYQELKEKILRMWNMRTVQVIQIVVRKCNEELGEVARKLDIIISISLPPKNYSTRNRKDFKKSIRVLE